MSLDGFSPEKVAISHKGKPLMEVRGLSLDDLAVLIRTHLDVFREMADSFKGSRAEIFSRIQAEGFVVEIISKFPGIAADVIAKQSDQPEQLNVIRTLPVGLQIMALQQIIRMSVEDVGGPKAFAALVMGMMGAD